MLRDLIRPILLPILVSSSELMNRYSGTFTPDELPCTETILSPVDETITIPALAAYCSTGAVVIDESVVVHGEWRLT